MQYPSGVESSANLEGEESEQRAQLPSRGAGTLTDGALGPKPASRSPQRLPQGLLLVAHLLIHSLYFSLGSTFKTLLKCCFPMGRPEASRAEPWTGKRGQPEKLLGQKRPLLARRLEEPPWQSPLQTEPLGAGAPQGQEGEEATQTGREMLGGHNPPGKPSGPVRARRGSKGKPSLLVPDSLATGLFLELAMLVLKSADQMPQIMTYPSTASDISATHTHTHPLRSHGRVIKKSRGRLHHPQPI